MKTYSVVEVDKKGQFIATVSGCGRNTGTLDTKMKSKRTAQRWAKELREKFPDRRFVVDADI